MFLTVNDFESDACGLANCVLYFSLTRKTSFITEKVPIALA